MVLKTVEVGTAFRNHLGKDRAALVVTLKEFREETTRESFLTACHDFVEKTCGYPVEPANDRSWRDCYDFLKTYLPADTGLDPFSMVFEYVMPDSRKQADVLLLTQHKVIILEFKQKAVILKEDAAQAAGYRKSLSHYHYETEKKAMTVEAYLVYTQGDPAGNHHLVDVLTPENFTAALRNALKDQLPLSEKECCTWIASPFYPLKNIAEATLQLFKSGDLPNIKTIREGDIKAILEAIDGVIADRSTQKSILFVSGVPGSGKTLVGLKTVYDHAHDQETLPPIYLSGNDPLVNILQNTLSTHGIAQEGKSYIQAMKNFKTLAHGTSVPLHNIIVFDEAQRAWDTDYREPGETEATLLLRLGDRIAAKYGKVTILCLIGEGQSLYFHEETGMPLWAKALTGRKDWNVYIPVSYQKVFGESPHIHASPHLTLNTSIRHDFIDVSPWVEAILDLDLEKARKCYCEMVAQGFVCWRFRDASKLPQAVSYVKQHAPGAHTGIIVSFHLRAKPGMFGPQYRGCYVKAEEAYHWYTEESYQLTRGASEFLIQGIELEYPIVSFVGDYFIQDGKWKVDPHASNPGFKDLEKVIQNVYRVLLTRSRKGMFLYFPKDPKLDETYGWFASMMTVEND
ncbi:DNA/RNA helicase domain-containing protein [Acidaminococcus massiliensis]|uniref:DNA/RNA helicase domain-containing protein n=1 Tax=Acidaminococcus massiliensis TaxID=1852375 RepID=UPI00352155B7